MPMWGMRRVYKWYVYKWAHACCTVLQAPLPRARACVYPHQRERSGGFQPGLCSPIADVLLIFVPVTPDYEHVAAAFIVLWYKDKAREAGGTVGHECHVSMCLLHPLLVVLTEERGRARNRLSESPCKPVH